MDFELTHIYVSYPPFFRLTLTFLAVYGVLALLGHVIRWRNRVEVTAAALAQAMIPSFAGSFATWTAARRVAEGYRLSGGGPASAAAGAAEAQVPLLLGLIVAAALALIALLRKVGSRTARGTTFSPARWSAVVTALVLLGTGELFFCSGVQRGLLMGIMMERIAIGAAVMSLVLALLMVVAVRSRDTGSVSVLAISVVLITNVAGIAVLWSWLGYFRRIAMGVA